MITPWRQLEFVHAVRQPLLSPSAPPISGDRNSGDTAIAGTFNATADRAVDQPPRCAGVVARAGRCATRRVGDGPRRAGWRRRRRARRHRDPPRQVPGRGHRVGAVSPGVRRHQAAPGLLPLAGASRFSEFFAETALVERDGATFDVPQGSLIGAEPGVVPFSEKVMSDPSDGAVRTYVRGRDYTIDYEGGRITWRQPSVPDRVLVTFVAPPNAIDGPSTLVDIYSTSRPPAPKVRYIVPTFGWERGADTGQGTNTVPRRRPAGLPRAPVVSVGHR